MMVFEFVDKILLIEVNRWDQFDPIEYKCTNA